MFRRIHPTSSADVMRYLVPETHEAAAYGDPIYNMVDAAPDACTASLSRTLCIGAAVLPKGTSLDVTTGRLHYYGDYPDQLVARLAIHGDDRRGAETFTFLPKPGAHGALSTSALIAQGVYGYLAASDREASVALDQRWNQDIVHLRNAGGGA